MPNGIDLSAGLIAEPLRRSSRSRLPDLLSFARENNLTVGSTTGGRHNVGSRHYSGNAIDIKNSGAFSDEQVAQLSRAASAQGFLVRDERRRPAGQKVWGGPHVHVEYPDQQKKPTIDLSAGLDTSEQIPPPDKAGTTPNTGQQSVPNDPLSRMRAKYPWTRNIDLNVIDSTAKGDKSRKLEFYPASERDNPQPGKPTVEIFDKGMSESDLMGEVLSHHLPSVDPRIARFRQQVLSSMTPRQKESIRGDYESEKKAGLTNDSFEMWLSKQGGDSFFRGYPTGQWPANEYTPQQRNIYHQLQSYLDKSAGPSAPNDQAILDNLNRTFRQGVARVKRGAQQQVPETIEAPGGSVEVDLNTMKPRESPAMQARTPSTWERLKETVAPYVPGLATLDTPGGIKTDLPRGLVSGVTLGYAGDPRQVSREEQILDPEAQAKANLAHGVGEYGSAFLPYVGAEKAIGSVIKGTNLLSRAARTGAVFGGVEAARQGVNAIRGRETNLAQIPASVGVGVLSGGLMGQNPGVLRRVGSLVAPQAAKDVIEGAPPEQIATSAVTNTLFGLMGGGRLEDGLVEPVKPKAEPIRRMVEAKPPPSPEMLKARIEGQPVHHSQYQPRRVRGEGKGQFKKGKPVVPEVTDASTIRSNQEVLSEVSPTSVGQESEVARGTDLYRGERQPVDQVTPSEILTRRPAESAKTEAEVVDPVERAAPKSQNFTQFANERKYPSDYDVLDHGDLGPSGSVSKRARKAAQDRQANRAELNAQAHREFEDAIRRGEVIDTEELKSRRVTKQDLEARDTRAKEQEIRSRIASAESQIQTIENLGPMSHLPNGKLKKAYQRTVDIYNERRTAAQAELDTLIAAPKPAKTEAKVEPLLTRAPLQVRPLAEPRPPLTLVRNQAERSFPKSAEAAGLPGGENLKYDPITNEESLAKAEKRIKQVGVDRAASEIVTRKEASAGDVATGIRLMQTFTQAGQHERAADVAGDLAQKLTQAGQSVQAASIISRLSPEGVLLTAQRQLPAGKKLTSAQSEALTGQAKTVQEADARIADLEKQIAEMQANVSAKKTTKPKLAERIGTLEDRLVKLETEARARLEARKQAAQKLGPQSGASAIPLDIADYAIVGAAKIARKGMSTAKWTAEMVSEFGEEIRPHLQKIYRESYSIYDDNRKQMKSEAEQRSIKRENPTAPTGDLDRLIQQRADARKDARTARAQMARLFNDLTATPWTRIKAVAGDVLNVPRTLKSSLDLSAPRQGAMWILNHPIEGVKTFFGKQIKSMREVNYDKFVDELESDPDYALMTRSGLALTTTDSRVNALTAREEAFMSRLAGKIPGVSHSERAYTTFLDTARSSWFKQLKNVAEMKAQSENRQITPEEYQAIANFVNIATGRGNLGKGWLNNASPFLNAVFFAPKFAVSKVQIFDPRVYARMPKGARTQAIREGATYFGAMAATALMLKYGLGLTVGLDPESSEFMKLRIGNTRYDLANGTGQYVVLAARLLRNAENKRTGKKDKFGHSLQENIDRFTRYKYSPPAAMARNVWEGKNAIGEKTNLKKEALEVVMPLFEKDLYDAYKEEGLTGVAKTTPGFVGVGVNTYGDKKKK